MGTSVSQASPSTTNWLAVALAYVHDAIPVDRLVQELWRAAQSEPAADWGALLSEPGNRYRSVHAGVFALWHPGDEDTVPADPCLSKVWAGVGP